jgi:hypothetical protein
VTDSMSGFLGPEEEAALEQQRQSGSRPDAAPDVSLAILRALDRDGSLPTGELLAKVAARPRQVFASLDELESASLVRLRSTDADDVVELTNGGRAVLASHAGE